MKQKTLLDEENRLELLSQLGDPLEILNRVIKWEKFRSVLNQGSRKEDTGKGGRLSYLFVYRIPPAMPGVQKALAIIAATV